VAKYSFVGAAPLYYTASGLWAEPGKAYALEAPPADGNWVPEGASPVPVAASEPVPAPSPAEDAVHAAEALLEANPELAAKIVKEAKSA
jgi:hypothetical protein